MPGTDNAAILKILTMAQTFRLKDFFLRLKISKSRLRVFIWLNIFEITALFFYRLLRFFRTGPISSLWKNKKVIPGVFLGRLLLRQFFGEKKWGLAITSPRIGIKNHGQIVFGWNVSWGLQLSGSGIQVATRTVQQVEYTVKHLQVGVSVYPPFTLIWPSESNVATVNFPRLNFIFFRFMVISSYTEFWSCYSYIMW